MERLVPESEAARTFERLRSAFERAAGQLPSGAEASYYVFGGHVARVRVGGQALCRELLGPFRHLRIARCPARPPRLDVCLWDENETGVRAAGDEDPALGDEPLTDVADTGRFVLHRRPRSVAGLDRASGRIVGAVAWDDDVDVYERGKPLARLLAEWYADQALGVVHAGLVARGPRGVLLAGRGGSGKSTLSLACARAGLDFLGEDYAALEVPEDGRVIGHSVYNSVFLTPVAAGWFPELAAAMRSSRTSGETKSLLLVADAWPSRLRRSAPIEALVICRVSDAGAVGVRTAGRAEALRAVAPSSLLGIHGRRTDSLERLSRLIERVPCYRLDLGGELAPAIAAVEGLLARGA